MILKKYILIPLNFELVLNLEFDLNNQPVRLKFLPINEFRDAILLFSEFVSRMAPAWSLSDLFLEFAADDFSIVA